VGVEVYLHPFLTSALDEESEWSVTVYGGFTSQQMGTSFHLIGGCVGRMLGLDAHVPFYMCRPRTRIWTITSELFHVTPVITNLLSATSHSMFVGNLSRFENCKKKNIYIYK
jgi:hypothetical protein